MPDAAELQAQADAITWFHTIDLGQGVKTRGLSEARRVVTEPQLPQFPGHSVLDIGAWDGYYSFLAERDGTSRVVALDHYAWGVDMPARDQYWRECAKNGELPDHKRDTTEFWHDDLPGRRGFDFAKKTLKSKVEPRLADFTTVDLESVGVFDIVLYLGVLYHMKEPLTCLERVRAVTGEVAVIETVAMRVPDAGHHALLAFHAGGDLNRDFGNWYVPTIEALEALVRAAGFSRVEIVQGPPPPTSRSTLRELRNRFGKKREKPIEEYRAIVHAYA